jgi:hypothetical protein
LRSKGRRMVLGPVDAATGDGVRVDANAGVDKGAGEKRGARGGFRDRDDVSGPS